MTSRPAQQHDAFAPYLDTSDTDTAQGDDTLEDYLQSEARLARVDAECRRLQLQFTVLAAITAVLFCVMTVMLRFHPLIYNPDKVYVTVHSFCAFGLSVADILLGRRGRSLSY